MSPEDFLATLQDHEPGDSLRMTVRAPGSDNRR